MRLTKIFLLISILLSPSIAAAASSKINLKKMQNFFKSHISELPKGVSASVRIEELGTGKMIFSHYPTRGLIPASTVKIVTAAAALDYLGPEKKFKTELYYTGKRNGGNISGDLVIKGGGDPYLVSERLWLLARKLARMGITSFSGGIKVNNTLFSDGLDTLMKFGRGQPYAAVVSPTSLNFNSVEIHLIPKSVGSQPSIEYAPFPHSYGYVENDVKILNGKQKSVQVSSVTSDKKEEVYTVKGFLGRKAKPAILYHSVQDASAYIAHVFLEMLNREGIKFKAGYRGETREEGRFLTSLKSLALLDLIRLMNTYSNNFMAEMLFQAIGIADKGAPGSLKKSNKAVTKYLSKIPNCNENINIVNGSGLNWETQLNASCLTNIMQKNYREFRYFADLIGSMPVGNRTGTLENRFARFGTWFDPLKVRAKTGTLWSQKAVTSLAGFVSTESGHALVYSLILNNKNAGSEYIDSMRQWEEKSISQLQKLDLSPQ